MTENRGQITGCARVNFDLSIRGFAEIESPKRILGQLRGHVIRFWAGKASSGRIVSEGLESVLSIGTVLPEFELPSQSDISRGGQPVLSLG